MLAALCVTTLYSPINRQFIGGEPLLIVRRDSAFENRVFFSQK